MLIPKSGVVYTDSFRFGDVDTFALSYIITCTGVPDIKIQMEQSIYPPAVENVADTNFAVPRTVPDIEVSLTSTTMQHSYFDPLCLLYVRFKITEQTGSIDDTTVNMWMSLQKKFRM